MNVKSGTGWGRAFAALALAHLMACGGDADEGTAAQEEGADAGATDALNDASDETTDATSVDADPDAGTTDAAADSDGVGELDVGPPSDRALAGEVVVFEGTSVDPDVRVERLCLGVEDPAAVEDKVNIPCALEGGSFAPEVPPSGELVVMVWNMERGLQFDEQLQAFQEATVLPQADVLLLSELDRGCSRTGYRDVARDLARALGMNYVFATEFVELPRIDGAGGRIDEACEHGNAILSRYPLANVGSVFHRQNHVWFGESGPEAQGEPRLGGRVLLWADVVVGDELLRAYTLHYESNPVHQPIQIDQAAETVELAGAVPWQTVVGGDTNNVSYFLDLRFGTSDDPTVGEFLAGGFVDAHAALPVAERGTRNGLVIDLLWGSGAFFSQAEVCPRAQCAWSDHQPVWATVTLDGTP